MSSLKFNRGDVVHLNSSPKIPMTVFKFTTNGQIIVMYEKPRSKNCFDYRTLFPEMLTLVKKYND